MNRTSTRGSARTLLTRLGAALVAPLLAASTLAVVGAAAPANAAGTCATKTTLTTRERVVEYGGYASLRAEVTPVNCSDTFIGTGAGTVVIERSVDGGRSWQSLKTGDAPSYVFFYGEGILRASGLYRARYTGGRESTSYEPTTFTGSASGSTRIDVIRDVSVKDKSRGGKIVGRFKITPAAGLVGKKLTFQVKKGKKWKKYKRVKLRANGVIKTTFAGSRKGINYRLVVPAAAGLSGYVYGPYRARRY